MANAMNRNDPSESWCGPKTYSGLARLFQFKATLPEDASPAKSKPPNSGNTRWICLSIKRKWRSPSGD
ncbi:MAG: hypothetical protein J6Y19_07270, partial [Kiritimatiellae bacterium]|nr:hypothetical protein [Kiritimatiellia bacterium]